MRDDTVFLDPIRGAGPYRLAPEAPRPNVVLITTDMVPPQFHTLDPDRRLAQTPNLDALGQDALVFSNAFCTSPVCSPSRAAYLTGRHSYITTNSERHHDGQEIHLRDDEVIWPRYLKAAGYRTRHVGKSHVGTHAFVDVFTENDSPWDRWSPPWFDDDAYVAFLAAQGLGPIEIERPIRGRALDGVSPGKDLGGWIAPQNGRGFPEAATYPAYLVDRAIAAIEGARDSEPLYLQLDFFAPHQPFAIPAGWEERESELRKRIEVPESYRPPNGAKSAGWQARPGEEGEHAVSASAGAPDPSEPRVYRAYRRNWGLVDSQTVIDYRIANILQYEMLDRQIGRFFDHLRACGRWDSSCIAYLADHGEMNGELGLVDKGTYLNPQVLRVPLTFKPPGGVSRGVVDVPVSLIDLGPTILESLGIDPVARFDGFSLTRTAAGEERPASVPILADIWNHVVPNPTVATVFKGDDGVPWLFAYNASDDVDELYCLDGSDELANRVGDPSAADTLRRALRRMDGILCADDRWICYRAPFHLDYGEELPAFTDDGQLFIR
jgi:hypothetical protein